MSRKSLPICYVAHPVGDARNPKRRSNIAHCKAWIKLLVECVPHVAFNAPWLPYVETLDEATHRERGIRDDMAMLGTCDLICAVGMDTRFGVVSKGVLSEWARADEHGLGRIDLDRIYFDVKQYAVVMTCCDDGSPRINFDRAPIPLRTMITRAFTPYAGG